MQVVELGVAPPPADARSAAARAATEIAAGDVLLVESRRPFPLVPRLARHTVSAAIVKRRLHFAAPALPVFKISSGQKTRQFRVSQRDLVLQVSLDESDDVLPTYRTEVGGNEMRVRINLSDLPGRDRRRHMVGFKMRIKRINADWFVLFVCALY